MSLRLETGGVKALSGRESEVLALAAEGLTDKEIARRIGIGTGTVKTYWSRVRGKLGVGNRTASVALASSLASHQSQPNGAHHDLRTDWWDAIVSSAPFSFVLVDLEGAVMTKRLQGPWRSVDIETGRRIVEQVPGWMAPSLQAAIASTRKQGCLSTFKCLSEARHGSPESTGGVVGPVRHGDRIVGALVMFLTHALTPERSEVSFEGTP